MEGAEGEEEQEGGGGGGGEQDDAARGDAVLELRLGGDQVGLELGLPRVHGARHRAPRVLDQARAHWLVATLSEHEFCGVFLAFRVPTAVRWDGNTLVWTWLTMLQDSAKRTSQHQQLVWEWERWVMRTRHPMFGAAL